MSTRVAISQPGLIGQSVHQFNQFHEVVTASILPGVSNTVLSSSTRHFDSCLVSNEYRPANRTDSVPLRWHYKCCSVRFRKSAQ
jgi:hypothetical protein